MNTMPGFIRLTALAAVCALGFGVASSAQADGFRNGHHGGWNGHGHNRSHFIFSINLADALFGGGYRYAPRHRSRDRYYDNYGYNDNYNGYDQNYGYYEPYPQYNIGFSYSDGGYGNRRGRDHWDRDDRGRWHGDHGGRRGDHDQHGGWDRDHYHNDQGGNNNCGDPNRTDCDPNRTDGGYRHRHW